MTYSEFRFVLTSVCDGGKRLGSWNIVWNNRRR